MNPEDLVKVLADYSDNDPSGGRILKTSGSGGGGGNVVIENAAGTETVDVLTTGALGVMPVAIVDAAGNQITTFGSGTVTVNNGTGAAAVNIQDGGNSITVDATSLPLPTGASTAANQTTGNTSLGSIDTKLTTTNTNTGTTATNTGTIATEIGATNETAAASDSATSGLNGLIRRLFTYFATIGAKINGTAQPIASTYSYTNGTSQNVLVDNTTGAVKVGQGDLIPSADGVSIGYNSTTNVSATRYRNTSVTNTKQQVSAVPCNLYGFNLIGPVTNTSQCFLKIYDALSASVTVGTTTPVMTIAVPASTATSSAVVFFNSAIPTLTLSTALTIAVTLNQADNDNTAPVAGIHVGLNYK